MVERNTEGYRVLRSYHASDGIHGLKRKTAAVFKASAVFIIALIPHFRQKLIYEITGMRVDLDAVESRSFGKLGGHFEVVHSALYLISGHRAAYDIVVKMRRDRRGGYGRLRVAEVELAVSACTRAELQEELCTPPVRSLYKHCRLGYAVDVVHMYTGAALGQTGVDVG